VTLCWRPEHVRLGDGELEGVVVDRSFQGNYTDLTVRSGDVEHRIQTPATALKEGDRARFAIAPELVVLLEDEP
jgi:ABC-type Fe3+/spermidine/putrescine transport system ATPase subunit